MALKAPVSQGFLRGLGLMLTNGIIIMAKNKTSSWKVPGSGLYYLSIIDIENISIDTSYLMSSEMPLAIKGLQL